MTKEDKIQVALGLKQVCDKCHIVLFLLKFYVMYRERIPVPRCKICIGKKEESIDMYIDALRRGIYGVKYAYPHLRVLWGKIGQRR